MKIEKCATPRFSNNNYRSTNGYFYSAFYEQDSKVFYTEDEWSKYRTKIKTILNNKGNGKIGKTLYVGKGSNAPRHKIKMMVEENNIKKTTIIENSDTVIFDKKVINDVYNWFDKSKLVKIAIVPFTQNLLDIIIKYNKIANQQNYTRNYTSSFNKKCDLVIYHDNYVDFPPTFKSALGTLIWGDYYEQDNNRTKNLQEVFNTIEYYFQNPHGNIIWDSNILETLNSDGIDLDEDYINTLNSMFSSNDPDNIRLALEMMSNVNLEKHGLVIALLLNKWKGVMSWGNGNTGGQAYKILDRYFRNKGINWKIDYRTFTTGLFKNYNDEESREIIADFLLRNINSFLSENNFRLDGEFLQIDSFKISKYKK